MFTKKWFGLLRMHATPLTVAAVLIGGGCKEEASTVHTEIQASESSQARPAAFYVPADAVSVKFRAADPTIVIPFVGGAEIDYELPPGSSFDAWLDGLKQHLETLGWSRLSHSYHPTTEPVGDAAGWREGGRRTPWMWKEAWANPEESKAIQILVVTKTVPSGPRRLLRQGASVSILQNSGRFVQQRLAEYAEKFEVSWIATQTAPHDK